MISSYPNFCWVSEMLIPVYGVSEEEALWDKIF